MFDFARKLAAGRSYHDFLAHYGTDEQRRRWQQVHDAVRLTSDQTSLLGSFKRKMPVLCLAGAWCGDCVEQCPIFDHFAQASSVIDLKFFDRDADADLAAELKVCGGARVPVALFLSEDGHPVHRLGDRTLAKYRHIAATQLGAACPTGLAAPSSSMLATVTQEWLNEFERVQLVLRTSPRLRQLHGD